MSKSRRILAMALSATMGLTMLAGCNNSGTSSTPTSNNNSTSTGGSSTPTNSGDGSKGKVYWLNFKPEADTTLQEIAKTYKDQKGIEVKVVTAASGTYEQTLLSEMDKSEPPTLFVMGNAWAVDTWKDYAMDLKDTAIVKELSNTDSNMYSPDGKLVAIPYAIEAYGIIVNNELVEKAGYKTDDIKNFAKLKEVVEDIHARKDELGFDAFTACDMDDSSNWRFVGHMANLEYFYEQKDSHWTEPPATITGDYMQNFKNLYDLCINNCTYDPKQLATGGHDHETEFLNKKAAFTVQGSWQHSKITDAGLTNVTMIPYYCGVEGEEKAGLNYGTENFWGINNKVSADDQQATIDFLVWCVTDSDASAKLSKEFGYMPYKGCPESDNTFIKAANKYASDGCYTMNWATSNQPDVNNYRSDLVSALNAYNADQSDANWENVKNAFVGGWASHYKAAKGE